MARTGRRVRCQGRRRRLSYSAMVTRSDSFPGPVPGLRLAARACPPPSPLGEATARHTRSLTSRSVGRSPPTRRRAAMSMPYWKYRPYETVDLPDRTWPDRVVERAPDLVLDRPARRQPGARQADGLARASSGCSTCSSRSGSRRSRSGSPRPRRPTSTSCARSSRRSGSRPTRRSRC